MKGFNAHMANFDNKVWAYDIESLAKAKKMFYRFPNNEKVRERYFRLKNKMVKKYGEKVLSGL